MNTISFLISCLSGEGEGRKWVGEGGWELWDYFENIFNLDKTVMFAQCQNLGKMIVKPGIT